MVKLRNDLIQGQNQRLKLGVISRF